MAMTTKSFVPTAISSSLQRLSILLSFTLLFLPSVILSLNMRDDKLHFAKAPVTTETSAAVGSGGSGSPGQLEVIVQVGKDAVLECEAMGSPGPTLHWLRRGERIQQAAGDTAAAEEMSDYESSVTTNHVTLLKISSTKSRLFIDCATPTDEGEYICVADTLTRRITQVYKLVVDKRRQILSHRCAKGELNGDSSLARIYMWTTQRIEMEGGDVQLFCRTTVTPNMSTVWIDRDNKPIIASDKRYQLLSNGDLLIKSVNWDNNMGLYRCRADNGVNSDEISTFLYPTTKE